MAKNAANINVGDADVYINGEVVGYLMGGSKWKVDRNFVDLKADEFGDSVLDMALTGVDLTLELNIAEITNANLAKAMPEARYDPGTGGDSKIGIGTRSGFLLSSNAVFLQIHPRRYGAISPNVSGTGSGNMENDLFIWKAVSIDSVELNYEFDKQRVFKVTYRALVDTTRIDGYLLGRIGNDTIS